MTYAELADRVRRARRTTVLTGAGVSAASGVPTFRGSQGLWRQFRPEDLATANAFARDPRLVWEWYASRRERIAACAPNAAHAVLARWSRRSGCTIVTQNVDDLHLRAGTERLVRLHGSIWELRCAGLRGPTSSAARRCSTAAWRDEQIPLPLPPRCPRCGGLARPAVVWFGEPLDESTLAAARAAARCDLFLMVGTSAVVHPAAGLVHEAKRHGAYTVEINPEHTETSSIVDLAIAAPAEVVLPELDAEGGEHTD
jgi:NAD-dependent deacetylase